MSTTTNITKTADEDIARAQVRLPGLLWRRVKALAAMRGETSESIVEQALEAFLKQSNA